MALEYIYDVIVATAGEPLIVTAEITGEDGNPVEAGCSILLCEENETTIFEDDGDYIGEGIWEFRVPAETTTGLSGRYFYAIKEDDSSLCFKTPLYFM